MRKKWQSLRIGNTKSLIKMISYVNMLFKKFCNFLINVSYEIKYQYQFFMVAFKTCCGSILFHPSHSFIIHYIHLTAFYTDVLSLKLS